jgi:hypothetical protein
MFLSVNNKQSQLHLTICTSTYNSFINVVYFLSAGYFYKHKVKFKQYTAYSLQLLIENLAHCLPFLRNGKHLGNIVFEYIYLPFHFMIFTRWSVVTSTTEKTYNSAHITKWLKKICMHFFKLLFHLVAKILQYCFEQYNITVIRLLQKNNAYFVYVTKVLFGIWHYSLQCCTVINIEMKLHVYTLQGKYEVSNFRKLIMYLKY